MFFKMIGFKNSKFDEVELYLEKASIFLKDDRFNSAIIETLKQYNFVQLLFPQFLN